MKYENSQETHRNNSTLKNNASEESSEIIFRNWNVHPLNNECNTHVSLVY